MVLPRVYVSCLGNELLRSKQLNQQRVQYLPMHKPNFPRLLRAAAKKTGKEFREMSGELSKVDGRDNAESEATFGAMLYHELRSAGLEARTLSLESGSATSYRRFDLLYNARGVWNVKRAGDEYWIQIAPVWVNKDNSLNARSVRKVKSDAEKMRESDLFKGTNNKGYVVALIQNPKLALTKAIVDKNRTAMRRKIHNPRIEMIVC